MTALPRSSRPGLLPRFLAAIGLCLALVACAGEERPVVGSAGEPAESTEAAIGFDPLSWFEGTHHSRGQVTSLTLSNRQFTAVLEGERTGPDRLRLVERFDFPEGDYDQIWTLTRQGDTLGGTVRTELEDGSFSEEVPISGTLEGQAATIVYEGYAPGGGGNRFTFTHRMVRESSDIVRNRVVIRFGPIPLAWSSVRFADTPEDLAERTP